MRILKYFLIITIALSLIGCSQNKEADKIDSIQLRFQNIEEVEYGSEMQSKDLLKEIPDNITFSQLDTMKIGEQTIEFIVTEEGKSKSFYKVVKIVDTQLPKITLSNETITIENGEAFNLKKYVKSVKDVVDGDLLYRDSKDIKTGDTGYYTDKGNLDTSKPGNYKIVIEAVDINGNKSEKEVKIIVKEKLESKNKTSSNDTNTKPKSDNDTTYSKDKNNKVIVVNAGHQGKADSSKEAVGPGSSVMKAKVSAGATGVYSKVTESQITLNVALKLRAELQSRGYTVIMTRTSQNVNISNKARAEVGNKNNAAAVISLHCDSTNSSSVTGAHTIAPKKSNPYNSAIYNDSSQLAQKVISAFCLKTGIKNRGVKYRDDLTGLNWSQVPAIYLEMGFISNVNEDKLLSNSDFQKKCAQGIATGIDNYFK